MACDVSPVAMFLNEKQRPSWEIIHLIGYLFQKAAAMKAWTPDNLQGVVLSGEIVVFLG